MARIFCTSILAIAALVSPAISQSDGEHRSFQFDGITLRAALDSLMRWYPVSIVYLDRYVEGKSVSASCTECSFDQALGAVLGGSSLTWLAIGNQVIVKERETREHHPVASVSGTVQDSLTGEWIAGATVLLQDSADQEYVSVKRWCSTNAYGFFSFPDVVPGKYTLAIRALGFRPSKVPLLAAVDTSMQSDCRLMQEDITLEEVTVEGHRTALTSAQGFTRGMYIRSTPSDQNAYLLDDARIYNPSHFGGVLSTFNGEVLNDVQVVVGGLPPSYGGFVGGIVDLSMRDGSRDHLEGSAGTGFQGSQLSLEGPINSTTTFLLSGRKGYPDVVVPLVNPDGEPSRQNSSELIAKVSHRISGSSQLSLSGYIGKDSYRNEALGAGEKLSNTFSWSNQALNLRWIAIASPSLFLHGSAVYTRYGFTLNHALTGIDLPGADTLVSSDYAIEDVSLRAQAENYYDEDHTLRAGVELTHHHIGGNISPFSTQIAPFSLNGFSAWEASVYVQDIWRILPRVDAELGARATSFAGSEGTFSAIDPRFSLLVSPDEYTRIYGSLTAINQFIHPYRNSGVFLLYPTIFWYPATDAARPSTSLQMSVGIEKSLKENEFVASAESYYRITNNLHEFGLDTMASVAGDLNSAILFGTGRVYGVELSLRKRTGDVTGTVSYNLSWVRETFAEINDGNSFAPPFDRRHELQVALQYHAGQHWIFGVLGILASDQSSSFAPKIVRLKSARFGVGPEVSAAEAEFVDVNGSKLPGFQRLEFSVLYRFASWGLPCQLSLRLVNAYGLIDPFVWQLQNTNDPRLRWNVLLRDQNVSPLYPTLSLMVRF